MKRAILAGVMAVTALAVPLPAEAGSVHVGIRFGGPDYYRYDAQRLGFERGREDGWREGYKDARRGQRFGFEDERRFRRADAGWHPEMGPRYVYAHGYRRGFEEAYRRGYQAGARQAWCRRDHRHDRSCGGWYDRDDRRDDDRYVDPHDDRYDDHERGNRR